MHCAPHSTMCPATVPAASRFQSVAPQPNSAISGDRTSPGSVERPVTTMSAPWRSASATGNEPTYTLADSTLSRMSDNGRPSSRLASGAPASISSSSRSRMSSPVTLPILSPVARCSRATSSRAARQASGFTPPAFATTLTPFSRSVGKVRRIRSMKSVA